MNKTKNIWRTITQRWICMLIVINAKTMPSQLTVHVERKHELIMIGRVYSAASGGLSRSQQCTPDHLLNCKYNHTKTMRNNENKRVDTFVWKYARTMQRLCDEIRSRCIRTFLNNGGFGFPREIDSARTIDEITVVFCNTETKRYVRRGTIFFSFAKLFRWMVFLIYRMTVFILRTYTNIRFGMSK